MFLFAFPPTVAHQEERETIAQKKPKFHYCCCFVGKTDKWHGILANMYIVFLIENNLLFTAIIYLGFDKKSS